jgi:hypothetical protein
MATANVIDKLTRKPPGPVNTVSNNSNGQTEGDLARASAAKLPTAARRPKPKIGLQLRDPGDAGFNCLDLVNGLNGVCVALDEYIVTHASGVDNHACQLATAAMVLSSIVQDRLEVP